jgi:acyl-CoA thioester hydrolase
VTESAPVDLTDPNLYGHWETVSIRYSDGDGMGHINNAVYAAWTEVARVTYIQSFMKTAPDWLDTVLARQTIDYLAETRFPGEVRVGARLLSLGNRSFRSGFGIFRDDACLATSYCVNVFFDMRSRTSTLPAPSVREEMESELTTIPDS